MVRPQGDSAGYEAMFNDSSGYIDNSDDMDLLFQLNDKMTRTVLPVTIFVGIETLLGFFGNLLVLYVFMFHYHKCNFRYFIICLSVIDFTSSIVTLPGEIFLQNYWYMCPSDLYCRIKTFFNMFTVTSEAICLTIIAIDRYRKVCLPFSWQIKTYMIKWLALLNFLCGFWLSLPVAIYTGNRDMKKTYLNKSFIVTVCDFTEKFVDTKSVLAYNAAIEIIISICLLVMIVLNIMTVKRVLTSHVGKSSSSRRQSVIFSVVTIENKVRYEFKNLSIRYAKKPSGNTDVVKSSLKFDESSTSRTVRSTQTLSTDRLDTNTHASYLQKSESLTSRKRDSTIHCLAKLHKSIRARQKTQILFILTVIFTVTTVLYVALVHVKSRGTLDEMSDSGKTTFLFFFRIVLINHVINPFVYGCLDRKFKKVVGRIFRCSLKKST